MPDKTTYPGVSVADDSNDTLVNVGDSANKAVRVNVIAGGGGGSVTQGTVPWVVDGSGATQPISAASLPLPTDAATEVSQLAQTASQGAAATGQRGPLIQGVVSDAAQQFTPDTIQPAQLTVDGRLRVATVSESNNFSSWGNPFEQDDAPFDRGTLTAWG